MASYLSENLYKVVAVEGKTKYACSICNRNLSSKQRITAHITRHNGEYNTETCSDGQTLFSKCGDTSYQCNICRKCLSSKRNVLKHLNLIHGKSPLKRTYKTYDCIPEATVPKRTLFRHKKGAKNIANKSEDSTSSPEISFKLPGADSMKFGSEKDQEDDASGEDEFKTDQEESTKDDFQFPDEGSFHVADSDEEKVESENDLEKSITSESVSEDSESESSFQSDEALSPISSDVEDTYSGCSSGSEKTFENTQGCNNFSDSQLHEYCVLAYAKRFNLSREATVALKKMASILSPNTNFNYASEMPDLHAFHYCEKCNSLFPEEDLDIFECIDCHGFRYEGNQQCQTNEKRKPRCEFIITNIGQQLVRILEKPGIWDLVIAVKDRIRVQQGDDVICDIIDGSCYKALCAEGMFLSEETHLSAIMNTDGIPLYTSSKVKLWPIFLALNELPPHQRFARENLIVAGMWQGKSNPPFKQYLECFTCEVNNLYTEGVYIDQPNIGKFKVKLCILLATLDLQAKGYVANMSMHNGAYGCSTCEESGVTVKKGKGHVKSYPYRNTKPTARSSENIKVAAQQATKTKRVKGICGVSGLTNLPEFDLVCGLVPDYMHGILLGVTKTLLNLWFLKTNSGSNYYIRNKIHDVSSRLEKMTPPDTIERLPRYFEKSYEHFKATELQVWLLYYCLPCLKNILDDRYLEHFALLSEGSFILLGDSITRSELERAASLLDQFYKEYCTLYGNGACGLNVHNVGSHMVQFVSYWGPLWCMSCFPFEDANSSILQSVHGTGNVTRQYLHIKQRHIELDGLTKKMIEKECSNDKGTKFLKDMLYVSRRWAGKHCEDNCKVVGRLLKVSAEESFPELLQVTGSNSELDLRKCLRVEIHNQKFYSKEYSRMKKRVCYFVISVDSEIIAINFFVVSTSNSVFAVTNLYNVEQNSFIFQSSGRHVVKITPTGLQKVLPIYKIMDKLFYMEVDNKIFVSRLPNTLGRCVFK